MIRASVRKMDPYVPGEQPADASIIKLNTNENPYAVGERVVAALRGLDAEALRRYPDPLCRAVREKLAALHGCAAEQVLAANGSDEILALCTRAFVEHDGAVGYFDPSYSLYPVLADIRGVRRVPVPLADDFDWPLDAAAARLQAEAGCSLFFFTNPNAPTGMLCAPDRVRAFCAAFDGTVVVDQAYVDFATDDCDALALSLPNVLAVRSFSKSYSLAGLRFGYALGPPDLVGALYKIKDSYNVGTVVQALALAALEARPAMEANVQRVVRTRERLAAALRALGWSVPASETNFLWVRPAGLGAEDLFDGLRRQRILVRYFPGARTGDYVRITVGTDEECDRLADACRVLMGERA